MIEFDALPCIMQNTPCDCFLFPAGVKKNAGCRRRRKPKLTIDNRGQNSLLSLTEGLFGYLCNPLTPTLCRVDQQMGTKWDLWQNSLAILD